MILADEPALDPRLKNLSSEAFSEWLTVVTHCELLHTNIVDAHDLLNVGPALVGEWEQATLVARLPFGNLKVLPQRSHWDLDHAA